MGSLGLLVGPAHFWKSRWLWQATAAAAAFELTLPLWAGNVLAFNHEGYFEAVSLSVVVQFVPVFLLVYSSRSPLYELESLSTRRLWPLGLASILLSVAPAAIIATALSSLEGATGTLNWDARVIAFLGMLGMGLTASFFMDHRLAPVVALLPVIAPMTTNPSALPLQEVWNFVAPGDGTGTRSLVAVAWLLGGLALRTWGDARGIALSRGNSS